jgi:cytochrome c biogenesis protein CcmG/thiol:disulfide interchange protein DsbE
VVKELGGRARFVEENYGDSRLARRFGVTRYPAIFVDDILVATPKDFGFYGKGEGAGKGRYAPIRSAEGQERFRSDLSRTIALILAGRKDAARAQAQPAKTAPAAAAETAAWPVATLTTLDGKQVTRGDLRGQVVAVEIWATWCLPCRATLAWLGELQRRHGDRLAVVALAVESDAAEVRKLSIELRLPFIWAMGTPALVRSFGEVSVLPTLLLFDRQGRTAATFFGAAPGLHEAAAAKLASLLE